MIRLGGMGGDGVRRMVGARRTPPLWMKAGDVLEVDVERIGCLRNPVAPKS